MAAERSKRSNAGSRMNQMLEAEDEDDFYKTTYGGFEEEAEDNDFKSEDSDSESTDSDFSIDEHDEVRSDGDDDEPKRKKRVVTKAYKEPKREDEAEKNVKVEEKKERKKTIKPDPDIPAVQIYMSPERKSMRRSTALKSKQTQSRQKRREEQAKVIADIADKKNVNVEDVRRLTQEELLVEAKLTEQINLKSLENYQKLELERKRTRVQKQVYRGPIIRYHSVTMPVLNEDLCLDPEISVDEDGDAQLEAAQQPAPASSDVCSRTFITFTDHNVYNAIFPQTKCKPPQRQACPVTRLPAKYIDPITQTPYASLQAFRFIRDAYVKQLGQQGEGNRSSPTPAKKKDKVQPAVAAAE
ncbi:vacuolar protein sorting-associated protein 72 homolog isoform X2 [Littorina saxatilis]|uniref:Vacuolar protein sorting-associated protein 72 homolog n=2 Tax=Littorina saxatilis TaxID=31220 RepID=A0AAN9B5M3_9CAEN